MTIELIRRGFPPPNNPEKFHLRRHLVDNKPTIEKPLTAVIYWQSTVRINAVQSGRMCFVNFTFKPSPETETMPRLSSDRRHVRLYGTDVIPVADSYNFPMAKWLTKEHLPVYLAREYFRKDFPKTDDILAFLRPEIAIGRALACGKSLLVSKDCPSSTIVRICRKWGARLRVSLTVA